MDNAPTYLKLYQITLADAAAAKFRSEPQFVGSKMPRATVAQHMHAIAAMFQELNRKNPTFCHNKISVVGQIATILKFVVLGLLPQL